MRDITSNNSLRRARPWSRYFFAATAAVFACGTIILSSDYWINFLPSSAIDYREQCFAGLVMVRVALAAGSLLSLFSLWLWNADNPSIEERVPWNRWDAVICLIFLLIATAVRIYPLSFSLWWDELTNVLRYIRRGYPVIFTFAGGSNNHILNSAMVRLSFDLFGEGEVQMRLPAFIVGVITPVVTYMTLKRPFGRSLALTLSLWLTLHVSMIKHATEARGYAGGILCVFLAHSLFLRTIRHRTYQSAALYISVCFIGFGFLPTFLLIPFSHGLFAVLLLLWSFRSRLQSDMFRMARHAVFVCLWAAVLSFVLFGFSLPQSVFVVSSCLKDEFRPLGLHLMIDIGSYMAGINWIPGMVMILGLSILGLIRNWRNISVWFVIAPLFIACIWLLYPETRVVPRTLFFVLPSITFGAALGFASLFRGSFRWRLVGGLIASVALMSTIAQTAECFRIKNPDLKGVSERYAGSDVVLIGPQADVNIYYFPDASVMRHADCRHEDVPLIKAADVVVRGCVADSEPDVRIIDCGFYLAESLPSWHPSRPTCFHVYLKNEKDLTK